MPCYLFNESINKLTQTMHIWQSQAMKNHLMNTFWEQQPLAFLCHNKPR